MRRLLPLATLLLATLAAGPACAWDPGYGQHGWGPRHGWHRPPSPPPHAWRPAPPRPHWGWRGPEQRRGPAAWSGWPEHRDRRHDARRDWRDNDRRHHDRRDGWREGRRW